MRMRMRICLPEYLPLPLWWLLVICDTAGEIIRQTERARGRKAYIKPYIYINKYVCARCGAANRARLQREPESKSYIHNNKTVAQPEPETLRLPMRYETHVALPACYVLCSAAACCCSWWLLATWTTTRKRTFCVFSKRVCESVYRNYVYEIDLGGGVLLHGKSNILLTIVWCLKAIYRRSAAQASSRASFGLVVRNQRSALVGTCYARRII